MYSVGNYTFGVKHLNLEVDAKVVIGRTTESKLDGQSGTILGRNTNDLVDFYIILLETPYNGQKAINLIETCLCPI